MVMENQKMVMEKSWEKTFAKSVGTLSQICIVSIMSEKNR